MLLAIESQANIHYAMPVKDMVYDALQYARQVESAIASHRKSSDYRGSSSDEYLSGLMKQDRLMPVITLVMYFGAKTWDGSMSIHEMFERQDAKLLSLVPDYRINLKWTFWKCRKRIEIILGSSYRSCLRKSR